MGSYQIGVDIKLRHQSTHPHFSENKLAEACASRTPRHQSCPVGFEDHQEGLTGSEDSLLINLGERGAVFPKASGAIALSFCWMQKGELASMLSWHAVN
jgi:hypothetical protein